MIQGGSRDPGGWVRRKISSQSGQKGGTWIRWVFSVPDHPRPLTTFCPPRNWQGLRTPCVPTHWKSSFNSKATPCGGRITIPLVGRWYSLTLGRVPATSEFFTKVLASCRDPLPSCQSQGPPPPESPLDRPRLDWDPHLCQVHSQFYKAVPAFRLNEPILLSSCPAEAQCCAWRVVDVPHIGMGWIRPCQQPILWASAAPCSLSPDSLSRLM